MDYATRALIERLKERLALLEQSAERTALQFDTRLRAVEAEQQRRRGGRPRKQVNGEADRHPDHRNL